MSCRICGAKADAFVQASEIAHGVDDGTAKECGFTPSPNSRYMSRIFWEKASMHRLAAESHKDDFHAPQ